MGDRLPPLSRKSDTFTGKIVIEKPHKLNLHTHFGSFGENTLSSRIYREPPSFRLVHSPLQSSGSDRAHGWIRKMSNQRVECPVEDFRLFASQYLIFSNFLAVGRGRINSFRIYTSMSTAKRPILRYIDTVLGSGGGDFSDQPKAILAYGIKDLRVYLMDSCSSIHTNGSI